MRDGRSPRSSKFTFRIEWLKWVFEVGPATKGRRTRAPLQRHKQDAHRNAQITDRTVVRDVQITPQAQNPLVVHRPRSYSLTRIDGCRRQPKGEKVRVASKR